MAQQVNNTFRVPIINDEALLALFDDLVLQFPNSEFHLEIPGQPLGVFNNRSAFEAKFPNRDWSKTRSLSSGWARLLNKSITVNFHRYVVNFGERQQQEHSLWENEFFVDRNSEVDPAKYLDVLGVFDQHKSRWTSAASIPGAPSSEMRDFVGSQVAQLTEFHVKLLADAEKARLRAEEQVAQRLVDLDAEFARRREVFEREVHDRRATLADEEKQLADQKKELDDRGHMHARRGLRAHITEAMQKRMAAPPVSRQTNRLRTAIIGYSVAGILLLFGVSAYGAWDTHALVGRADTELSALVYATARFVVPLAVATGLLIYLLNWLRRVHADDVRAERDLERYRYDIDRASWAVETILEGQSENGTKVPEVWIAGAVQGLFSRSDAPDEDSVARDAIAALLGFSAKAQIGTDGANLEFGRGDLRRMSRGGTG